MKEIYKGIVVKSVDYGSNDRIITILTSDDSFVVFKAKGASKLSSPFSKYTIPYSICEFELESKSENAHKVLVGANNIYYPKFINQNIKAIAISSYISESLIYLDYKIGLYEYISEIIKLLDKDEKEEMIFLSYLYYFIKANGIGLQLDCCEVCGKKKNIVDVDYTIGGLLCSSCSINRKSNEYIELLYKVGHYKGVYMNDYDIGTVFNLTKDLIVFLNENSWIKIKSEKFVLNSLFNI